MTALTLTAAERATLEGAEGPGAAMAMRVVTRLATVRGATRLRRVSAAHVDSCLYHGRVGIDFARGLLDGGARVSVPTTLNVGSVDLVHPGLVTDRPGRPPVVDPGTELMGLYQSLGARPTFTCAPYQEPGRPLLGEHVAWAESNAVVFANSVLGARTDRYGDFLDISAAVTGLVPDAGLHLTRARRATVVVDVTGVPSDLWGESMWTGVLGHVVGTLVGGEVAAVVGLPPDLDEAALKAFGAAGASSGSMAMFHVVGRTPEAPDLGTVLQGERARSVLVVTETQLRDARESLCHKTSGAIDAVSLGTPHASPAELLELAEALERIGPVHPGVEAWVSTSRGVAAVAAASGVLARIEAGGFRVLADTCTYVTPVLAAGIRSVATNSVKWAHYAPANIGVEPVLATLEECVRAAATGELAL
ncbi:aconitase X [Actinomycetota bacterium]